MKKILTLVCALSLMLALIGCTEVETGVKDPNTSEATKTEAAKAKMGDTVIYGDFEITFNSAKIVKAKDEYALLDSGIVVGVTVANKSDETKAISTLEIKAFDKDGSNVEISIFDIDDYNSITDKDIRKGGKLDGYIILQENKKGKYYIEFAPILGTGSIDVEFEVK